MTREQMLDRAVREAVIPGFGPGFETTWLLVDGWEVPIKGGVWWVRNRFAQIAAIEGLRAREAAR